MKTESFLPHGSKDLTVKIEKYIWLCSHKHASLVHTDGSEKAVLCAYRAYWRFCRLAETANRLGLAS